MSSTEFEIVIGLEVHVQLKTRSKVFAQAPYHYGAEPNTLIDPVVLALPGALPVLNKAALEQSVRYGLLVGAEIPPVSKWDRKNYFYPDSPKNYQLSQKDFPITIGGEIEIELPGPARNIMGEHKIIRLNHAHLEEDVGKLSHATGGSLVDYNRAGAPLLEIVTEPELRSADEAVALLNAIRMLLISAGIADCDMEKGQMRCDANVSVRPIGQKELNTRTEMKNLNSISGVKNAIEYEARRQIREMQAGKTIQQETRGWNAETGRTYTLRTKEDAHDYRYFPDPDLMPVKVSEEDKARLNATLPERPYDRQRRYMKAFELPYTVTSVFVPDRLLCEYFEAAVSEYPGNPLGIANLIANDLLRDLAASGKAATDPFGGIEGSADAIATVAVSITECPIKPVQLAGLVKLTDEGVISKHQAKDIFTEMFATGKGASVIVDEKGLRQSNDTGEIENIIKDVLALPASAKSIAEFRAGNEKALNALKGPVMKASSGKANPKLVDEIIRKLLG